jgi:hypothetical protein
MLNLEALAFDSWLRASVSRCGEKRVRSSRDNSDLETLSVEASLTSVVDRFHVRISPPRPFSLVLVVARKRLNSRVSGADRAPTVFLRVTLQRGFLRFAVSWMQSGIGILEFMTTGRNVMRRARWEHNRRVTFNGSSHS